MTGTTPYQVRRATAGDTNALADIATRTFALACPPDTLQQDIDDFTRAHLSAAAFAAYLAEPERHLFILESAGGTLDASGGATGPTTIGYAMTIYGEPAESSIRGHLPTGNLLELSKFYIDPGHHQRGAAQALMSEVLAHARTLGVPVCWLGVNQHNPRAIRFYTKSGFERCGVRTFRVGAQDHADYLMVQSLSEDE